MLRAMLLSSSCKLLHARAAAKLGHLCCSQNRVRLLSCVAAYCGISSKGQGARLPDLAMAAQQQQPVLSLEQTLEVVKIPPNNTNPGARVEHIEVTADGQLSEVISTALQLPHWFVLELIRFGAVHYSPIMPPPALTARPRMSEKHLQHVEQLRAANIAKLGRNPKLQHPKRVLQDVPVVAGGYVRVHVHPKRFPAAHSVDWKRAILADMPEYVVVNKPAGVQVPPTVDNLLESVVCCTAMALDLPQDALLNTHRLDAGTSGVVVLAKNSNFAAWFNALLREKPDNVVKLYRCLTAKPPAIGSMVHYATMRARAAGEPAHTRMRRPAAAAVAGEGSSVSAADGSDQQGARCELIVLHVEQVCLTGKAAADWGPSAYETTLQLVTGRTHQIRAQMAAEGCPLLGDQLYQALAVMWQQEDQQQKEQGQQQDNKMQQLPKLEQKSSAMSIKQQHEQQNRQCPADARNDQQLEQQGNHHHAGAAWSRIYQEDPLRPIGLQAFVLRVRDVDRRMTARAQQEQQQQQQQQQERKQHVQVSPTFSSACVASVLPENGHLQQAKGSSNFAAADAESVSAEGVDAGGNQGGWVEFRTGLPWWRC